MTAPLVLLLDRDRVRALRPTGVIAEIVWDSDAVQPALATLSEAAGVASAVVLVVGLGLLEIARPDLPPLDASMRRALLTRDADRYFPIDGAAAVSWTDGFAFAVPASRLTAWVDACTVLGPVRAVTTIVDCLARAGADGNWRVAAGVAESGQVVVREGVVREVRRMPADGADAPSHAPSHAPSDDAAPDRMLVTPAREQGTSARDADMATVARGALDALEAPLGEMLLDQSLERRISGARRRRWMLSAAMLMLAVGTLAYSVDQRHARTLSATDAQLRALTDAAASAQRAEVRLQRARNELRLLADAGANTDPGVVLARLGAVLPRDAFIQRLEWDGTVWRIDGSAADAPRIVPLLDADPRFVDVRIVAASSRFLDAGRQRESYSISFRTRAARGTRDAP